MEGRNYGSGLEESQMTYTSEFITPDEDSDGAFRACHAATLVSFHLPTSVFIA